MEKTTYQLPEIRDASDNIIQSGTYGKKTAFANSTNNGVLDYINNNLEAIMSIITGGMVYYDAMANFPSTGDVTKMYVDKSTGKSYGWNGTQYTELAGAVNGVGISSITINSDNEIVIATTDEKTYTMAIPQITATKDYATAAAASASAAKSSETASATSESNAKSYSEASASSAASAAESASTAEESATEIALAIIGTQSDKAIFGSTFDTVNAQGTRVYASSGRSWSPSTDTSSATDDFAGAGPWDIFEVLTKPDSSGVAQIVAYEGTSSFDQYKNDDDYGADLITMFPVSYVQRTVSTGSDIRLVSSKKYSGFDPSPMHYRNGTLHEYVGLTRYVLGDDGNGGVCSRTGHLPKINITENNFETLARARGLRVAGLNEMAYLQHIGTIKYNNYNWQSAVGNGVTSAYKIATATVSESGVQRIIISNSDAASYHVGQWVHITTLGTNYRWKISSIDAYDTSNMAVALTGNTTTFNSTVASTKIETCCIPCGETDTVLGQDGVSSAGSSVLTMGVENMYGNCWKLLSGACRIGTEIYINPSPDTQYAWPSSASDAVAKGWTKYSGTYCSASGWIKALNDGIVSFPQTVGGNSASPVGDYYYASDSTSIMVALFGGGLDYGANAGPFCFDLYDGVDVAFWDFGALGVFIPQ